MVAEIVGDQRLAMFSWAACGGKYEGDDDEDDDDVDDDDDDDNDDDGDDDGVPALLPGCKPSPGYSRLRCCTCKI